MEGKKEILIGLLGMTGAGKTTFASLASGRTDLEIGNTLKSCTQETQVVRFELDDYTIVLVDTPGFDDDTRSDIDILRIITEGLSNKGLGSQQQRLDGLILLHPITSTRIGGNERKRTRLLEAILGEHAYKRVIIATTMWDDLRNDDNKFSYRMEGRTEKGEVWHEMSSKGATITRHYNNPESAHKIIRDIIQKSLAENGGVELQLQRELADGKGRMGRTTVGTQVRKFGQDEINRLKSELKELEADMPDTLAARAQWKAERADLRKRIRDGESQLWLLDKLTVSINWLSKLKRLWG